MKHVGGVLGFLALVLVARPAFADMAPVYGEHCSGGEVCTKIVEGHQFVGVCGGGTCQTTVPIATVRATLESARSRAWGVHIAWLLGLVGVGVGFGFVDRALRRRREKNAAKLEGALAPEQKWRKTVRWVVLPLVLVTGYTALFFTSLKKALHAKRTWSDPVLTAPSDALLSLDSYPDPPQLVRSSEGSFLIASLEAKDRGGNLIVAYDVSSRAPLWWRAQKEWLEDPLRFVVTDGRVVIFDGAGGVEVRVPKTGLIQRKEQREYRVDMLEADGAYVKVWDTQGPYGHFSLDGNDTGMLNPGSGFHGTVRDECRGGIEEEWRGAIADPSIGIEQSCKSRTGRVAVLHDKKTYALVAIDKTHTVIWRTPVNPRVRSWGALVRLNSVLDLVFTLEDCTGKECRVIARDLATGKRRWDIAGDGDTTFSDLKGSGDLVLFMQREGTWTVTSSPTWRYDVFEARGGEREGTIPSRP